MKTIADSKQVGFKPRVTSELSARYEYPEHSGILVDRITRCDISNWATGTTRAKRPEVGQVRREFSPVRKLASIRDAGFIGPVDPSQKDSILIGQHVTDNGAKVMEHRQTRIAPISRMFAAFYARGVLKHAKPALKAKEMPLEAIPSAELEAWIASKREACVPRE